MHLPQQERSGCTPTTDQLQSRAMRKPARTSSTIRRAPRLVGKLARPAGVGRRRRCLVDEGRRAGTALRRWRRGHRPPPQRRLQGCRRRCSRTGAGWPDRRHVMPLPARSAPRRSAVIGAPRAHDAAAAGVRARDHQRHRGGVRAVLAEHRPVGVADHRDDRFGEIDHQPGRTRSWRRPSRAART